MNPQPLSLVLLLPALPGVGWAAAALLAPLRSDRALHRLLTPLLALAMWILAVALVARRTSSLNWGLVVGTLSLAGAGALAKWRGKRSPAIVPPPEAQAVRPPSPWMGRTAVLVAVPIAILAFGGHFYDEDSHNGHVSIISQMQEDRYPPPNECFPDLVLRYHFGFDLVSAGLTAMTRLPIRVAMDLLTVFCWVWSWCLLWLLGDRLGRPGTGGWVALATLLGSGAAIVLVFYDAPSFESVAAQHLLGNHLAFAGKFSGPPLLAYFFQKPVSLGVPFTIAVMLLVHEALPRWRTRRELLLGLFLAALSLSQALFFVALLPTVTATEVVTTRRLRFLVTAVLVLAVAAALGGMIFAPLAAGADVGLLFKVWIAKEGFLPVVVWHLSTLGALLPVGLVGFFLLRRMRLFFLLLVGGSLATLNLMDYKYTWDIVKFAAIAATGLGILSGLVLGRLAARRTWKARLALGALVLALVASGTTYIAARIAIIFHLADPYPVEGPVATDDDLAAARWLRRHAASGELVFAPSRSFYPYVQNALQVAWPVSNFALAFGTPMQRIVERELLFNVKPDIVEPYLAQGLRWLVVEEGSGGWMEDRLDRWLREGSVEEAATFGKLRVYRLAEPESFPVPADVSRRQGAGDEPPLKTP